MDFDRPEQLGQDDPSRYRDMFGMFLESIPSSVLFINRDLKVIFANRNFLIRSRRTHHDVMGQRLEQVRRHPQRQSGSRLACPRHLRIRAVVFGSRIEVLREAGWAG